jgi:hypothetical protein
MQKASLPVYTNPSDFYIGACQEGIPPKTSRPSKMGKLNAVELKAKAFQ